MKSVHLVMHRIPVMPVCLNILSLRENALIVRLINVFFVWKIKCVLSVLKGLIWITMKDVLRMDRLKLERLLE